MTNKISIITGGGSGLGLAIGKALVKNGQAVCLVGRSQERLMQAKVELLSINPDAEVIGCPFDISDETSVTMFYKDLEQNNYSAAYLFNVAGNGVFGDAKDVTKEKIDLVMGANLTGLILMTANVLEQMECTGGKVINIMSTAAQQGKDRESIYCAAKWGARGFTESLKATYKGTNVKIIGVYPGGMKTAFWDAKDCYAVDQSNFMDPDEVGVQIVEAVCSGKSYHVSNIVIERN